MAVSTQINGSNTTIAFSYTADTTQLTNTIELAAQWAYEERQLPPAFIDENGQPTVLWVNVTQLQKTQIWDYVLQQFTVKRARAQNERNLKMAAEATAKANEGTIGL